MTRNDVDCHSASQDGSRQSKHSWCVVWCNMMWYDIDRLRMTEVSPWRFVEDKHVATNHLNHFIGVTKPGSQKKKQVNDQTCPAKQTDKQTNGLMGRDVKQHGHTGRQTKRQRDRQADRQTNKQTDGQTRIPSATSDKTVTVRGRDGVYLKWH